MRHPPEKPEENHKITAMLEEGSEENRKDKKKKPSKNNKVPKQQLGALM